MTLRSYPFHVALDQLLSRRSFLHVIRLSEGICGRGWALETNSVNDVQTTPSQPAQLNTSQSIWTSMARGRGCYVQRGFASVHVAMQCMFGCYGIICMAPPWNQRFVSECRGIALNMNSFI